MKEGAQIAGGGWNRLIDDIIGQRWIDPDTGNPAITGMSGLVLGDTLDGAEADLLAPLNLGERLAVVSDENTVEAMGRRVGHALAAGYAIDQIVLPGRIKPTEAMVADIANRTRGADAIIAVGSGSLTDSCKYAAFQSDRPSVTFGTAASMNGYAASTASITLANGVKASLPARPPRAVFLDLTVSAKAPVWLSAAGLGDSLCRPVAQTDWWVSHRLFGTSYSDTPYALQREDEPEMLRRAAGLKVRDVEAVGYLQRVLTLCGLGVCFTGSSHHGSMGEHLISHWLDMFARDQHPGTTHGQQVGVASLTLARLQAELLGRSEPPRVGPTKINANAMRTHYGDAIAEQCLAEMSRKVLDVNRADALNARLGDLWPELQHETAAFSLSIELMKDALAASGGPLTYRDLGLAPDVWRAALKNARHLRARWSFLDLADDAGLLDEFIDREIAG